MNRGDKVIVVDLSDYNGSKLNTLNIYTIKSEHNKSVSLNEIDGIFRKTRFHVLDLNKEWNYRENDLFLYRNTIYRLVHINDTGYAELIQMSGFGIGAGFMTHIQNPQLTFYKKGIGYGDKVEFMVHAEAAEYNKINQQRGPSITSVLTGRGWNYNEPPTNELLAKKTFNIDSLDSLRSLRRITVICDSGASWTVPEDLFKVVGKCPKKKESPQIGKNSIVQVSNTKVIDTFSVLKKDGKYPVKKVVKANNNSYAQLTDRVFVKVGDLKLIEGRVMPEKRDDEKLELKEFKGKIQTPVA